MDQTKPAHRLITSDKPAEAGVFRPIDRWFKRVNELAGRGLPDHMNPLAQTGAIANMLFIIAVVSGVLLLIWYRPSVHRAYESVLAMAPWTAGLMRSIHRYSSDACMFFVFVHALYLFFAGRFRGPRWLAWTTGILLWTLLEMIGWTGYWLVWDARGQVIASSSARVLDLIPVFADPLSRSFLTNGSINSLFFFVIFFFHMVVPLAMAAGIYIHIARISRPQYLTSKPITWALLIGLVVISLLVPADTAQAADMLTRPDHLVMDAWYLAPLWLLERTTGGLFLALFLLAGAFLYALPFWRRTKPAVAEVVVGRCNACTKCYQDCPYSAITMVPRTDGKAYPSQSFVDPSRCVSCGICAGSCDSAGIGVPFMDVLSTRRNLEAVVASHAEPPHVLFVCKESLSLKINHEGACSDLPGYVVQEVPCLGWIHPLTVERLVKRGVPGVMLAGCGLGTCPHREGGRWTKDRFEGTREPALRTDVVPANAVRLVQRDALNLNQLKKETQAFRTGESIVLKSNSGWRTLAVLLIAITAAAIVLPTKVPWWAPHAVTPELIVSFKHAGEVAQITRTAEELEALPPHMRAPVVSGRDRAAVRLRVTVDGTVLHEEAYEPGGIMGDGNSIAVERFPLQPGSHHVIVEIDDRKEPEGDWAYKTEDTVALEPYKNCVVLFDKIQHFTWHQPSAEPPSNNEQPPIHPNENE